MATLKVKNVGPIRDAELEVKKHTIFIGPQGSGKSTLAKLIAIGMRINYTAFMMASGIYFENYNMSDYVNEKSTWSFVDDYHVLSYDGKFDLDLTEKGKEINMAGVRKYNTETGSNALDYTTYKKVTLNKIDGLWTNARVYTSNFFGSSYSSLGLFPIYVPTERMLTAALSNSVWNLIYSGATVPKTISQFGSLIENTRSTISSLNINFLNIRYSRENNIDVIYDTNDNMVELSQAASGYQAIIPLFQAVEANRSSSNVRFIIEEPELNLYPTTQKNLIYALVGGLQTDTQYHDAEWVITTHSPYVLSSYNTLILAYKVANKSEELRAEVEKIIPSRCWINPDDFAAYYIDKGTVRSIINPKTGLIMDNELDDVSEQLAEEQDQLLELNRSVPRD